LVLPAVKGTTSSGRQYRREILPTISFFYGILRHMSISGHSK
jgi:hypothetical protein